MTENIRILVVEDEVVTALLMKKELAGIGFKMINHVTTGENAIKSIETNRPDVILMDIGLSGDMDGIEAACVINKSFSIPIIFITGYDDMNMRTRAEEIRPVEFFTKPVEITKLQNVFCSLFHN